MTRFLSNKGLSMSQAQSISNIAYQRCAEIDNILNYINNASKTIKLEGETYVETQANPIPDNVVDLIKEKGMLSGAQGFLMECIKAKAAALQSVTDKAFDMVAFLEINPQPQKELVDNVKTIPYVEEQWGWEQLTDSEYAEYLEAEAMASHIGQFIHKNGKLTSLRKELPTMKTLEWIVLAENKKTPVNVHIHHDPKDLMAIHENLVGQHRVFEQKVNYFKAKVKNLVSDENARICKENANLFNAYKAELERVSNEYQSKYQIFRTTLDKALSEFEATKEATKKVISATRIEVDSRFQPIIDNILKTIGVTTE